MSNHRPRPVAATLNRTKREIKRLFSIPAEREIFMSRMRCGKISDLEELCLWEMAMKQADSANRQDFLRFRLACLGILREAVLRDTAETCLALEKSFSQENEKNPLGN